ncbi:dihydrodipicolinate synthase family protein [Marinoscillum sp. MHG1-6]|uniref:dihydrodipicolinate synthase family protein n=1 Tax=Marinoscillum sp. MHG1-6 TaxID=2959627 RepID=UPI00215805A4|nr:dihydrodipicolinate synthase family protein [Marinoscillum sp. MHG1-6]
MNQGKNFNAYKGVIPPLITPLKATDSLDVEGLEKLVEHVLVAPISGVFILGTTGEFSHISIKLREEMIERVCKLVKGRTKVLVGVADTSITESVNLAQKAAECGADSVVATPPYYFAASQPELTHYFISLAKRLPLPLFLYNMPVHTKTVIDPGTVKAVAEASDNVIGLKDSSANMNYIRSIQYQMRGKDFPIFCGPEEITADAVLLGGAGGVNGGANMFPKLYSEQYEAAANKDFERLEILRNKVLEISSMIYSLGKYGSSTYLQGLKCAVSLLGICDDYLPEPFFRFDQEQRKLIAERLEKLDMTRFTEQYL